jgi:methylmalonyl-CoA/ethylmalonyl-CoA epimerase
MIRTRFGEAFQMAFVPRDVDKALDHWLTLGAGPFFKLENRQFSACQYRGRPVGTTIDAYLGYWGDVQVELIRQRDDGPSVYRDWLDAGREGVHHLGVVVPDLAAARARCERVGYEVVQEIQGDDGMRIFYAAAGSPDFPMIECMTPPPATLQFFEAMRAAHREFDGKDPVRSR